MNILGIDTSCDDTAVAVVRDGRVILSSVVMSQLSLHAEYGGVVPEVASRRHLDDIRPAAIRALNEGGVSIDDLDAVAATVGPGLAGSLMVGYNFGRALACARHLPFAPVNHLEGHIYSSWLQTEAGSTEPAFPLLVLIVSGGHTELILMREHGTYERLGGTLDDAAGEAFDKVGRLLGLGFPGGPAVQRAASDLQASREPITVPRAWLRGTHDFSFSGVKTAVLHLVRQSELGDDPQWVNAMAAGFQDSVADVLATKTVSAAAEFDVQSVVLCGGVAANSLVREQLRTRLPAEVPLFVPPPSLCVDNGAMIASAAYYRLTHHGAPAASGDVRPGLALTC